MTLAEKVLSERAKTSTSSIIRDLLAHAKRPDVLSLAGGIPTPDLFPLEEIKVATAAVLDEKGPDALQYGLTKGVVELRQILADMAAEDGLGADPEDILVTTGSQQALDMLGRILIDPGDTVVVSDPTYLGALQAVRAYDPQLVGIPLDDDGMRTDVLEERLEAGLRPTACYVIPNFQNPTGVTLIEERRRHLGELARRFDFILIDDDPYGALRFEGAALGSLAIHAPDHTVRLRTASKTVAPGLRTGWMIGPSWVIDEVEKQKQAADLHTSTLTQHVLAQLFRDPVWLDRHLAELRPWYRDRRDALVGALSDTFGESAQFTRPSGGMFVWAELPIVGDSTDLLPLALERGMAFVPGSAFTVDTPRPRTVRLSYATISPEELRDAVALLDRAISDL